MIVQRVRTASGSRIEPPMDQDWSELEKLHWKLAVTLHDAGISPEGIDVWSARPELAPGEFLFLSPKGNAGPFTFRDLWCFLNGIGLGAELPHVAESR